MAVATITITDITQKPLNLYTLLTQNSTPGYTVVPAAPLSANIPGMVAGVAYLSVQASYNNGGTVVYKGDANVKTDGSRQAKEMVAGDTDVSQAYPFTVNLNEIYITASANGAKVNLEAHHA